IQNLEKQVQKLQHEIDQMKAQPAPAQSTPAPAAAAAPAPASSSPTLKAGPVTLTFGGFTALETLYRNKNETADIGSNYNTRNPNPYQTTHQRSGIRQSARP